MPSHVPALIAAYMRASASSRGGGRAGPFSRRRHGPVSRLPGALPARPAGHRPTRLIQRGGIIAIAVEDTSGAVTGAGLVDVMADGPAAGELAGVGVRAAFRRRGIASAISAYPARTAHTRGISLVFGEAGPGEEQLYRRTGFTDATTKIWASIRSDQLV